MNKSVLFVIAFFVMPYGHAAQDCYPPSSPDRCDDGMTKKSKKRKRVAEKNCSRKRCKRDKVMVLVCGLMSSGKSTICKGAELFGPEWGWTFDRLDRDGHIAEFFVPQIQAFWRKHYSHREKMPIPLVTKENMELIQRESKKYQDIKDFIQIHGYELANLSFNKEVRRGFLRRVLEQYRTSDTNLIVEVGLLGDKKEFKLWMKELNKLIDAEGWNVYFVKVDCDPDEKVSINEIKRRTLERGNRDVGILKKKLPFIHSYVTHDGQKKRKRYDFTLYTNNKSQDELVRELLLQLSCVIPRAVRDNCRTINNDEHRKYVGSLVANNINGLDKMLGSLRDARETSPVAPRTRSRYRY